MSQLTQAITNLKESLSIRNKKSGKGVYMYRTANISVKLPANKNRCVSAEYYPKGMYTRRTIDVDFYRKDDNVFIEVYRDNELIYVNRVTELFDNTGTGYYWYLNGKMRGLDIPISARTDLAIFLVDEIVKSSPFYNEHSVLPSMLDRDDYNRERVFQFF